MFAREGYPFIIGATVAAAVLFAVALRLRSWPLWLVAFVVTIVAIWVAWFFRDPVRSGERGPGVAIAPADGKVVLIRELDEPTFLGGRAKCVSIFMNVFSVHVNRYPVTGEVRLVTRRPGKFLNAVLEAASLENEQNDVGIDTGRHRVLVRQIAGLIARRIITDPAPGAQAAQGERFGLIRFGSRVDVFLPMDATLRVRLGEHTQAGATVIATLPTS
ncbi:MAG: phosphatidylserine decarboxylase family protein [Gemmatimonadaceae bacterium]|jgi:phosphatidylserine decarboxylase|nr:phosphatidylserine decarboxylase family protein [Gemmatimonadaceae bacterium]